jgi:poly(beta-D-mannuronate) lyase
MNITAPVICLNKSKATLSTLLVILVLVLPKALLADTITVSSIADLQTTINKAKPGDQIMLTDGVYTTTEDIIVNNKGIEKKPIIIAAQNLGKAEITGKGGFSLVSPAAYITIRGFKFTHAASRLKRA